MTATRHLAGAAAVALVALCGGCAFEARPPDVEGAKAFDKHPLYWLGERFEQWELTSITGLDFDSNHISFGYGSCEPPRGEGGCTVPVSVQVSALCHPKSGADSLTLGDARTRTNPDGAPIVEAERVDVKIYAHDPAVAQRAIEALRLLNRVPPSVAPDPPPNCMPPRIGSGPPPFPSAKRR
jgi:hypothetical protein